MTDDLDSGGSRRTPPRWLVRLGGALLPSTVALACYLAMIIGLVMVGSSVSRIPKVASEMSRYLTLSALIIIAVWAVVGLALRRLVVDEDRAMAQIFTLFLLTGTTFALGALVSSERDRELIRTGPSAAAEVAVAGRSADPLLIGDPYQIYELRLLHGDQREFIVTGAAGEFREGELLVSRVVSGFVV
ncbi:hypothetical protein [Micromonospora sp. NBC_01813]|uniref:hypothetical protein n=1 Tax=Micromonospora sp. NBC_01813 TaxID=2975988 RepID=UPI002DDB1F21|nr:hypothetical protein [Micromonospora sp. NBC_01813]WSA12304.1 hypothetical protein OG958_16855 [Micromonospora sp. NBC_01813]